MPCTTRRPRCFPRASSSCATSTSFPAATSTSSRSRSRSAAAATIRRSRACSIRGRASRSRTSRCSGSDNLDETQGTPTQGHDGRIDGLAVESRQTFVDYDNGLLYFLEPRPFAPRLGANRKPFDGFISSVLFRRDSLTGPPGSSTEPNPAIYDKYNLQTDTDARYFIDVEYSGQSAGGDITLGRGNILEGSDVVTVNGQALQRGRDYDIDYDLGRVVLKRQLGAADQLNIDYSYAPLFQQAGRTLVGSAFTLQGRNKSLGGAFLYESHGAQDIRPRLGEEPSRSLIGDLNTDWSFQPGWMTRLVDHLPGVRTTAPSELKFQAEVGASLPNPNTKNEVYIDDMEGVRDAVSLTMDASRWRWSSVPSRPTSVLDGVAIQPKSLLDLVLEGSKTKNAEVHWFSPYAVVKEHDLKPSLSDAQGGQNNRQVLAISIPRRPLTADNGPATFDSLWVGLTYPLDPHGIDLSKSQFLELWVNDFNDHHEPSTERPRIRGRHVRMHRRRHGERGPDALAGRPARQRAQHRGPEPGRDARRHVEQRGHGRGRPARHRRARAAARSGHGLGPGSAWRRLPAAQS
jgi:hypothetical protein